MDCGAAAEDDALDCWRACATRDAEAAGSNVAWVWVGVPRAMVCTRERKAGEAAAGIARTSSSSESSHVVREGCSRHSYIRSWLSEEIVA